MLYIFFEEILIHMLRYYSKSKSRFLLLESNENSAYKISFTEIFEKKVTLKSFHGDSLCIFVSAECVINKELFI